MKILSWPVKIIGIGFVAASMVIGVYTGLGIYRAGTSISQLLSENQYLKDAIANLTETGKIGGARILSSDVVDGQIITTVRFWEYDRQNSNKIIQSSEYRVPGTVVHFDALIIKFADPLLKEGSKSLYIWHRLYSDKMAPEDGFYINDPDQEPDRYRDFLAGLPVDHRRLFWQSIWQLAHEPDKLEGHGVEAVYGNVTYTQMQEEFLYIFQITPAGQIYVETHRIL